MPDPFAERFGRAPDVVWAAPGRVNLIGEHTDYNDGWVLPFALDATTTVATAARSDGVLCVASVQEGGPVEIALDGLEPGAVDGWAAYVAGAAWALGRDAGADLLVDSTLPTGAGLSSSAALCCASVGALAGRSLAPVEHARLARVAEADFTGVPIGMMDQLASVLGEAGHALLIDCRSLEHEAVPFDPQAAGMVLLVIDTKVQHSVGDGAYADRRAACERAAEALGLDSLRDAAPADLDRLEGEDARRARHVVEENERVLSAVACLRSGELERLGPLLSASHASLRDLYEVSCEELDAVCAAAERAGALGARMIGAGFGGSAIALLAADRDAAVRAAVAGALPQAEIFGASAAAGARQVR